MAWLVALCSIMGSMLGPLAVPAQAVDCRVAVSEAAAMAGALSVSIGAPSVAAGAAVGVAWARSSRAGARPRTRLFLVLAAPAASRLEGKGFLALGPGAEPPAKLGSGGDGVRAYVPLTGPFAKASGTIGIKAFRRGDNAITATVMASECPDATREVRRFDLSVSAGSPELVMQDRFATGLPAKRIRSNDGRYRLDVFDGRYEVVDLATGALLVARPGTEPNFSPTARFVAARRASDAGYDVVDLVSGTDVAAFRSGVLAWARADSFAVSGNEQWAALEAKPTFTDGGLLFDTTLGCHACTGWNDAKMAFDFNLGYAAGLGGLKATVVDLYGSRPAWEFEPPLDQATDATLRDALERQIALSYETVRQPFPKRWSMGGPLTLSHDTGRAADGLARFVVRHVSSTIASASMPDASRTDVVGVPLQGRGFATVADIAVEPLRPETFFDRLGAELATLAADPIARVQKKIPSDDLNLTSDERTAKLARLNADLTSMLQAMGRSSRQNQQVFVAHPDAGCVSDEDRPGSIAADWVSQAFSFERSHARYWLVQQVCYEGSAQSVNAASVTLYGDGKGHPNQVGVSDAIGTGALDGTIATHDDALVLAFRDDDKLIVASKQGQAAAVVDLAAMRIDQGNIPLHEPALLKDLRRSRDGRFLVQLNTDGRFFVTRVVDKALALEGAFVDDEITVFTPEGLYDTSFEGARSVQVRFPGIAGLHSFDQFAPLLRRPGLATALLSGQPVTPRPPTIAPPPVAALTVSAPGAEGQRHIHVVASGETSLREIGVFIDGRPVARQPVDGLRAETDLSIADPGGGRWVSAIAVDGAGLASLPSATPLPGPARPRGTLRAVVVGLDQYADPGIPSLNSAAADARNLAAALASTQGKAYAATDIKLLLDADVTPSGVLAALETAAAATTPDDTLLFFFAGHGVDAALLGKAQSGLVLTTNQTRLSDVLATSLPWSAVSDKIAGLRGLAVIILDACHSGLAGSEAFTSNDAAASVLVARRAAPTIVLAASKGRQESEELPGGKGGRFTNALIAAMTVAPGRDAADRGDLLDLGEIYGAVRSRVADETQGRQTPWLTRSNVVGEVALFASGSR